MGIFPRLSSLEPGFLKKDTIKFAKANRMFLGEIENMSDKELLKLDMVQIYVLPASGKRIEMKQKKKKRNKISVKFRIFCYP